jgi:hypothetical protein
MRRVRVEGWVAAGLLAVAGFGSVGPVAAATGEGEAPLIAQARAMGAVADLTLRFVQEDGPESGHVRVVLTPEARSLTVIEARMAAEQAFLQTLKEPGLGDNLKRIEVVVRLMPAQQLSAQGFEHTFVYLHKGGRDWAVLAPE